MAKVDHTYTTSADHTYSVTLTVTDNDGSAVEGTQSIEVSGRRLYGGKPADRAVHVGPSVRRLASDRHLRRVALLHSGGRDHGLRVGLQRRGHGVG